MRTLLLALLLIAPATADPTYYLPEAPPQARVVLVAEDGSEEARALTRCGFACALTHADTPSSVAADVAEARKHFKAEVSLVGLNQRAPVVFHSATPAVARICIEPPPPADRLPLPRTRARRS